MRFVSGRNISNEDIFLRNRNEIFPFYQIIFIDYHLFQRIYHLPFL